MVNLPSITDGKFTLNYILYTCPQLQMVSFPSSIDGKLALKSQVRMVHLPSITDGKFTLNYR